VKASYPAVAAGSKLGLHAILPGRAIPLVRAARERGVVWPLVKGVDHAGLAVDVKQIEPRTLTLTRFVSRYDEAVGVEKWSEKERRIQARAALHFALSRLNTAEREAADWIEPLNEADPPDVAAWGKFGEYLCEIVQAANAEGVKVALPAFNAGTPEWDEMQALAATGLFGEMQRGGHILTIHEGVWGADPIQLDFGAAIPGAPAVPGAGARCFRYRYLYHILAARDEVVPLVVSEFYAGGGYPPQQSPADILARFAWYDAGIRQDPYVLACLPFTIDPNPDWERENYTPAYDAVLDYLVAERDVPNGTAAPAPAPAYPPDATHVVANCQALNVRRHPWCGSVIPPVVRVIPLGTPLRAFGLYRTAAMAHGWAAVSSSSDEWVSAAYLKAVTP
jgi:hypothetical protein